jgi:hypothetical protein
MQKKKTALGNAVRSGTFDGIGLPSSFIRIPRRWQSVKSDSKVPHSLDGMRIGITKNNDFAQMVLRIHAVSMRVGIGVSR